MNEAIIYRFAD